jgi:DNA transformation protein and related proteins
LRAAQDQDPDHIAELFAAFGPVAVRHMFGGAGIFADGLMIALVSKGAIYLKADDSTIPQFEREGLKPFTYTAKTRKRAVMSYWRMPERLYDDPDELARWAAQALAVARGKAAKIGTNPKGRAAGGRRKR